jgi:hypothetical protein
MLLQAGYPVILMKVDISSFIRLRTSLSVSNECYPQDLPISDSTHAYVTAWSMSELLSKRKFIVQDTAPEALLISSSAEQWS